MPIDESGLYRVTTARAPHWPRWARSTRWNSPTCAPPTTSWRRWSRPPAAASSGSAPAPSPRSAASAPGRAAAGRDWIGLRANGDYIVTGVSETPLLPGIWWRCSWSSAGCSRPGGGKANDPSRPFVRCAPLLRRVLAPIDGRFKFVIATSRHRAVRSGVLPAGSDLIPTLWFVYFFRDPWRVTPQRAGWSGSPADGVVVIGREPCRRRQNWSSAPHRCRASRSSSASFDVHVNRAPIGGPGRAHALHQGQIRQCQPRQSEPAQRAHGDPHRRAGRPGDRRCRRSRALSRAASSATCARARTDRGPAHRPDPLRFARR